MENQQVQQQQESEMDFYCKECGEVFDNSELLSIHAIATEHKMYNIFRCELCGKEVEKWEVLEQHYHRNHYVANKLKIHKCPLCDRSFVRANVCNIHYLTHTDARDRIPYKCTVCEKPFVRQDYLQSHMRTFHEETLDYNWMSESDDDGFDQSELSMLPESSTSAQPIREDNTLPVLRECGILESTREILIYLLGDHYLRELNWTDLPTEQLLEGILRICDLQPVYNEKSGAVGNFRENVKLLFNTILEEDDMNVLFKNRPVDEIVLDLLLDARNEINSKCL